MGEDTNEIAFMEEEKVVDIEVLERANIKDMVGKKVAVGIAGMGEGLDGIQTAKSASCGRSRHISRSEFT